MRTALKVKVEITATVVRKDGTRQELGTIVEKTLGRAGNK
jgi:hypothetical protein